MRRADRLFQILLLLGRGKVVTAQRLAESLEVSERTVYRDIQDLMACGVPIDGEAGVGYLLRQGYYLPPLMFNEEELTALALGSRLVQAWADRGLGKAAENALAKIDAALPSRLRPATSVPRLFVPDFHIPASLDATLGCLRQALNEQRKIRINYTRADGAGSQRVLRPLGLFYWGSAWTLSAWCELRADFRSFRLDRMANHQLLDERFEPEAGKSLEDFLARVAQEDSC